MFTRNAQHFDFINCLSAPPKTLCKDVQQCSIFDESGLLIEFEKGLTLILPLCLLIMSTPHKRVITIALTPWSKGCPHIFPGLHLPG